MLHFQHSSNYIIEVDVSDLESAETEEPNDRPIIGVLSQEMDSTLDRLLPSGHNYSSYISASYVQWAESGGARVVPVIIGKEKDYYEELFSYINGLLLPGGSAPLTGPGGYAEVGQIFFQLAKNASRHGDPFPIWGTCNGFELLTVMSSNEVSRLTRCDSENMANPIHLIPGWEDSKVYGLAPEDILRKLTKEKVTINFHENCLTPTNFTKYKLGNFWKPLSYNFDSNKLKYISTIEAKKYPFVGVQFHPEKNIFEWATNTVGNIPHNKHAVSIALYFSTYFINMARRSHHSFPTREIEEKNLIYNFDPKYVGKKDINWTFQQAYLFH